MYCIVECGISQVVTLAFYIQDYNRESDGMIVGVQIELSSILSMKLVYYGILIYCMLFIV